MDRPGIINPHVGTVKARLSHRDDVPDRGDTVPEATVQLGRGTCERGQQLSAFCVEDLSDTCIIARQAFENVSYHSVHLSYSQARLFSLHKL